jgi:hypothetical protein
MLEAAQSKVVELQAELAAQSKHTAEQLAELSAANEQLRLQVPRPVCKRLLVWV